MNFSKRISFLVIFLFITAFNCNHTFGMDVQELDEKFQFLRLAANPEKVNSSDEMLFPVVTDCDKQYSEEMQRWHREATDELKLLDPKVNHSGDKSGYRNLCSLQISVVYNIDGKYKRRSFVFNDDIFLSGRDLSKIKAQSVALGQVELSKNPFTVILEPGVRDEKLPSLTSDERDTLHGTLARSNQADKLPIRLNKRFVSLDEFSAEPFGYEQHIIEYFKFASLLNDKQKQEISDAFVRSFTLTLRKNPFSNEANIIQESTISLNKALLFLPFNSDSNERSMVYFQQEADPLFARFNYNFCDSEQAIRLFIDKSKNKLGKLLGYDEDGLSLNVKQIEKIYINIASIRYMCPICQGTYLYDIKTKRSIQRNILHGILSCQKQDMRQLETLLENHLVVVYISGIKETAKDRK